MTLTEASEVFPQFQHPGTEVLYMLEGVMVYGHGDAEYTLRPGDTLLLDGETLHGPHQLVRLPIRFLAITAYPTTAPTADRRLLLVDPGSSVPMYDRSR